MYVCVCMYVRESMIRSSFFMCVCMHVCTLAWMSMCVCVCVCVYARMYVCMYMCMYTFIRTIRTKTKKSSAVKHSLLSILYSSKTKKSSAVKD